MWSHDEYPVCRDGTRGGANTAMTAGAANAGAAGDPTQSSASDELPGAATHAGTGVFGSFGSILGAAVGYMMVRVLPAGLFFALLGGLAAGLIFGLLPFFAARARRHGMLAPWALGACALSGAVMGAALAGPVALVLTAVSILREPGAAPADASEVTE